jgi:hypothetical protein
MLDKFSSAKHFDRCGSRLASTAKLIKKAIFKKEFIGLTLSNIVFQIALIFEKNIQDPQAELYTFFFNSFGKVSYCFNN